MSRKKYQWAIRQNLLSVTDPQKTEESDYRALRRPDRDPDDPDDASEHVPGRAGGWCKGTEGGNRREGEPKGSGEPKGDPKGLGIITRIGSRPY